MPDFAPGGKEPDCQQTLLVIKPDAVRRRLVGEIIRRVEADRFRICDVRFTHLERARAEEFYAIHQGKEFFAPLVEFMTSGPVMALRLERADAVRRLRELAGATDPKQAKPGTIRADFGTTTRENVIHASHPDENPEQEIRFYFGNHR
jgi:nucleoside-diphosphate kinase